MRCLNLPNDPSGDTNHPDDQRGQDIPVTPSRLILGSSSQSQRRQDQTKDGDDEDDPDDV
jgi:hypothetical protein